MLYEENWADINPVDKPASALLIKKEHEEQRRMTFSDFTSLICMFLIRLSGTDSMKVA